eukprot:3996884-Prymnesium_polylepis.1
MARLEDAESHVAGGWLVSRWGDTRRSRPADTHTHTVHCDFVGVNTLRESDGMWDNGQEHARTQ